MKPTYMIPALTAAVLLSAGAPSPGKAQNTNHNYVMVTAHADADSTQAKRQTVAYYDGLGRPVQTVQKGASTNGLDLADRVEYDSLGRESRTWQTVRSPYANGGPVDSAVFVPTAMSFYADTAPFWETLYDGSPLDRIRKVTGPGQAWHTNEKGVTSGYLTNAGASGDAVLQCAKYDFTLSGNTGISFSHNGFWPAGALSVDRTEDEDGRTLWVFKDMWDLVVLERLLAEDAVGNNPAVYADTYYLYDDTSRLVAVLPPELSKYFGSGSWSGSTDADPKVGGFAYQYRYDARGRMIAKKLPGAAWNYYIYDAGDRLVLTQDGNQRTRNEWSFRFQDVLGRECLTGRLTASYNAFSSPLAFDHVLAVRDRSSGTYGDLHGYTVTDFTLPSSAEVLTVNWWDDYTFLGREPGMTSTEFGYTNPSSGDYGERYGTEAQGLLTGHWSKTLGEVPTSWPASAVRETWYYDDHGRNIRYVKGYPSGSRMMEQSGYTFAGELTHLYREMTLSDDEDKTEAYTYTYDVWGRLKETHHSLDGGSSIILSAYTYDAVGRLNNIARGGTSLQNSPAALASTYTYNVRDWLKGISGSLFSETMYYETPRIVNSSAVQWNGKISSSIWKTTAAPSDSTWYDYSYDRLGRLTTSVYGSDVLNHDNFSRNYEYDLNGNMVTRLLPEGSNPLAESWSSTSGNQVSAYYTIAGANNPSLLQESYAYDAAGNRSVVLDTQGDTLSRMHYNHLNLPKEYVAANGQTIKYVYSADGEKLYVKDIPAVGSSTGTEYAANYRLQNNVLKMIHTDAGYYTPTAIPVGMTEPVYEHIWYLKDYLGNNRVLVDSNGHAVATRDYDPFGEQITVVSTTNLYPFPLGATNSPYYYGGKEWNETTSTYDFEARYLSPSFHRFTTMDPLSEKYYSVSPYAYCAGNPVNHVDPDGMQWYLCTDANEKTKYEYCEGGMSEDDKKKYKSVEDKGYYFIDSKTNMYYSLFGETLPWTTSEGQPTIAQFYNVVDRLVFTFFMNRTWEDNEGWGWTKCSTYIEGWPSGIYNSNHIYYGGRNFSTLRNQDLLGSDSYLHTTFDNSPDRSAAIYKKENLPIEALTSGSYVGKKKQKSYWLRATNALNGVGLAGFTYVQLEFDGQNASNFLRSCVNIFPNSPQTKDIKHLIP